ncbi:MAG: hypothetical protein WD208_11590 [Dehalococcoidia bacterium]
MITRYAPQVATADLQDALLEYVANREMGIGGDMIWLGYGLGERRIEWLMDQLRHGEDVVPDVYCDYLRIPREALHADVVRTLEKPRLGGSAMTA